MNAIGRTGIMKGLNYPEHYYVNKETLFPGISESLWNNWRWQLRNKITGNDEEKWRYAGIRRDLVGDVVKKYPFAITPYFFCLINFDNAMDPLAKQVFPHINEIDDNGCLAVDPFSEEIHSPVSGLIKRFPDRVVVTVSNICASYCRYCTRKWMWGKRFQLNDEQIDHIIRYLKDSPQIREVILSGGEPFLLPLKQLEALIKRIFSLSHIDVIRIGSRILSFLPQKITSRVCAVLKKFKPLWIMTHFNHSREFTPAVVEAVDRLVDAGVVLCNQSVLLRQVNDEYEVMKTLCHDLQKLRIKPYYLFQCDYVQGTSHFHASVTKGKAILNELKKSTGGVCLPLYVIDLPDRGKIPVVTSCISHEDDRSIYFKDYNGVKHKYPKIYHK